MRAILAFLLLAGTAHAQPFVGTSGPVQIAPGPVTTGDVPSFASGGTAQTLFGGLTPTNGWAVYNPNATDTCWASDHGSAVANAAGSVPLAPLGGFETPNLRKPVGPVSVLCPTTGDKLTADRW